LDNNPPPFFCSASFVKASHRHQRSQAGTARQKKRRQSVLCAGHPMSRPTGPHGGSAHPAALAETPKSDSEPSPKFADAASVF